MLTRTNQLVKLAFLVAVSLCPALLSSPAQAQVEPVEDWSLVNGKTESCNTGICAISGGRRSSDHLFHKLKKLNTRNADITKITIDNDSFDSVFLANIDSNGSKISVPLEVLGSKADITILSPGGISIYDGFGTTNIANLTLSTADKVLIGSGVFDIYNTSPDQAILLNGSIDSSGLSSYALGNGNVDISIDETLTIDSDLLIVSDDLTINNSLVDRNLIISGDFQAEASSYIRNTTIVANSINFKSNGTTLRPQGFFIEDSHLQASGNITLEGKAASESLNDHFDSSATGVEVFRSKIESTGGNIDIDGFAGQGNGLNTRNRPYGYCNDCGETDSPRGDYIDISGHGVDIQSSHLTAINGIIDIYGRAGEGSVVVDGNGINVNEKSILSANTINLDGTGAKADTVLKAASGIRISDSSEIKTSGSQNLQGRSANTAANLSTHVYRSHGISIGGSTLESNNGLINLEGTGASGNQVKRAYGIYLQNESSVRAAAIKLTGNGGKASDLNVNTESNSYNFYGNSYNNAGITLENQASLDSNPSNDNGSPINLGLSEENNGLISLNGHGGTGVEYVAGIALGSSENRIDSGGDLVMIGTAGRDESFVDSDNRVMFDAQGVSVEGGGSTPSVNTLHAQNDILIRGTGGYGQIVENATGVFLERVDLNAKNIKIEGYGGQAEKFSTLTWGTMLFNDANVSADNSLTIYGKGGIAKTSQSGARPSENGGIVIFASTIDMANSTNVQLIGEAGDGGELALGTTLEKNKWTVGGTVTISGKGGAGDDVYLSAGVNFDLDEWSINGDLDIKGTGGQGVKTTANYGIGFIATKLFANSILLDGTGGNSTNTDDSETNYGIGVAFSSLEAKTGDFLIEGIGGSGGYDNTGVGLVASNIKALNGIIDVDGYGGSGKVVQKNNGVSMISAEKADLANFSAWDTSGYSLDLFDSYVTSDKRIVYGNRVEASEILINGYGGIPSNKNVSKENFGLSMAYTILSSASSASLYGQGGDGGQSIAGVKIESSSISAGGDTFITGLAGEGDRVTQGEGIILDQSTLDIKSANQVKFIGTGSGVDSEDQVKSVNLLERGEGIKINNTTINVKTSSPAIEFSGTGGQAADQINSRDNTGIKITNSTINSEDGGGNQVYVGIGGLGGKLNTGIVFDNTTVASRDGALTFSGTGGRGVNIQESLGIFGQDLVLSGSSISLDGKGGESVLMKDAVNEEGLDTFNQTAKNIGVEIENSQFTVLSGQLSITGNGGSLSIDGITNPDTDSDVDAISVASSLEGVTLTNITSSSPGATYISGQAGKPIAGDMNRGTSIVGSTIQTATASTETNVARNALEEPIENRIEGNAYSGTNDNYGLSIDSTDIESTHQDLILSGTGGLKATGEKNFGIYIGNASSVTVGSEGNSKLLNIYGAGGDGTDMTGGILTENTSYTVDGTINMYGESQGAGQFGDNSVEIYDGVNITSTDDTNIGGDNDVNISDSDIDSGNDTNITAENDVNLTESTIDSGNDTNLTAGADINISDSAINSGNDTNLTAGDDINIVDSAINSGNDTNLTAGDDINISDSAVGSGSDTNLEAGNNVNITGSTIDSGNNTNIKAGESINIAASRLSAGNTINLQATNITTSAVEFNSPALSIQSDSFIAGDGRNQTEGAFDTTSFSVDTGSESSNDSESYSNGQLTLSLSGNVNYFIEPAALNSEPERNDASGGLDLNRDEQVDQPTSDQSTRPTTALSSAEIRERHTQTEEQSANFVAEQLGLRRQPALTIQAIQKMLTNGDQIMNGSRQ